jgi:hypothetical protein
MKKVFFFLVFFAALCVTSANAQCSAGTASTAVKPCCMAKAAKAATSDASIEMRKADDGTVSYVRKEADAAGTVKFVSVQFDEASSSFVNVAPKSMTATEKSGMTKKSCSAGASSEKKGCCAGGEKKSCGGAKTSTTAVSATQE